MRQTLLFGGLESLGHNINRRSPDLRFLRIRQRLPSEILRPSPPRGTAEPFTESCRLGLWLTGNLRRPSWLRPADESSFFDLKATLAQHLQPHGIFAAMRYRSRPPMPQATSLIGHRNRDPQRQAARQRRHTQRRHPAPAPNQRCPCTSPNSTGQPLGMTARRSTTFTPLPKANARQNATSRCCSTRP